MYNYCVIVTAPLVSLLPPALGGWALEARVSAGMAAVCGETPTARGGGTGVPQLRREASVTVGRLLLMYEGERTAAEKETKKLLVPGKSARL